MVGIVLTTTTKSVKHVAVWTNIASLLQQYIIYNIIPVLSQYANTCTVYNMIQGYRYTMSGHMLVHLGSPL